MKNKATPLSAVKLTLTKIAITALTVLMSQSVLSGPDEHGHNHDAPGLVQAPKGGLIKTLDSIHVEVVNKGQNVQIHFYDHDMKQVDAATITTTGEVELPRTKKKEKIALVKKDQSLEYTYDAKKSHRYTLHLMVKDPTQKSPNALTFTVEPKKAK
ncbi:MAG: hypothetical protein ACK5P5_14565 [Pseudobdellovibrionaceae bacterium]